MTRTLRRAPAAAGALVLGVGALLASPAFASTPSDSGTISPADSGVVTTTWTGQIAGANANSDCSQSLDDSLNDHHGVTLAVPAGFYDTHTVTMTISETATLADSILTVSKDGVVAKSSDGSAVGGSESYAVTNPSSGIFDAITCSFAGASPYDATLTLTTKAVDTSGPVGGTSTTAGASSYGNYPVDSVPGGDESGEPSIGVDWNTGNVYFQANLTTIKAKFPSYGAAPALTDVSCLLNSVETLDPIMYTDSTTGRTGVSNLLANPLALNSITQFFSGDPTGPQTTCDPSQGGGEVAGPDHQTLGGGTYPKPLPVGVLPAPDGRTFYYCSQTILAGALCSRSDDDGLTFTNGTPPYVTECGGLHGHVRVAPDGTVYLPNKSCGDTQGVAVSTDAGQTWTVKHVPGSTPGASDPSVSVDRAGNVYFGYTNGDGTPAISVSHDQGDTWGAPIKAGDSFGIANSVFPEVITGDDGRAAFAFVGTPTAGNRNAAGFGKSADGTSYTGGIFHLYVATTVDGGATYQTVDATPADPVQRGQICTDGTTCSGGRNLLDFNDISVDKAGHVVVAYADGCTGACVASTTVSDNTQSAVGVISRQIDGPLLFASPSSATDFNSKNGKPCHSGKAKGCRS